MAFNFPLSPSVGQIYTNNGATYIWDGTKWKAVAVNAAPVMHGGVQIYRVDNTTLGIRPVNGGQLIIGGISRPVVAMTKSIAGAPVDAPVMVYAYWTGSAIDYEFNTTAHVASANGVEVKSGDATRTLIGCLFRSSTFGFTDTEAGRFVLNWFEGSKTVKTASCSVSAQVITATGTTALVTTYFLCWANTSYRPSMNGISFSSGGSGIAIAGIFCNGLGVGVEGHAYHAAVNTYFNQCAGGPVLTSGVDTLQSMQVTARCAGIPSYTLTATAVVELRM